MENTALDRLEGIVMGLQMAVCALIAHHSDREAVVRFAATAIEGNLDAILPTALPEAMLDGIREAREQLLAAARISLPTPGQSDTPARS